MWIAGYVSAYDSFFMYYAVEDPLYLPQCFNCAQLDTMSAQSHGVADKSLRYCNFLQNTWKPAKTNTALEIYNGLLAPYAGPPMEEAYNLCAKITAEYAKTFYLGTKLMPKEKARAIW